MCVNYDRKESETKLLTSICCPAIAALYFTFQPETWAHYFKMNKHWYRLFRWNYKMLHFVGDQKKQNKS